MASNSLRGIKRAGNNKEDTLEVVTDLWKKSRKGNGNDKTRENDK